MLGERIMALLSLKNLDGRMQEVVRGASTAFLIKILAAGVGFASNIVLARCLGAEGAGHYFLVLTVVTVAAVFGRMGLNNTILRFASANVSQGNWESVKGVYAKGIGFAVGASGLTGILMFVSAPVVAERLFNNPELTGLLRWMSLAAIPLAISALYAQLLRAVDNIRDAMMVLSAWVPLFFTVGTVALAPSFGPRGAVWAYILATVLTTLIAMWVWRRETPCLRGIKGHFETGELLASSIPLFFASCWQLIMQWCSNCFLGVWSTSADVGIFAVANRTASLTTLILVAVNSISAPKFAALYSRGDLSGLGRLARGSAKMMTIMSVPIIIPLVFAPGLVMGLFGPQFAGGGTSLALLALGQFVNVATGSVTAVLMMCGYERVANNIMAFSALCCVVANLALIPFWGVLGAAAATAITLIAQNLLGVVMVWRLLGIMTIPGLFSKRAQR
ncbi:oligosaccharide flippase family protein [Syntrophobacter fumaroxidans]|nr:oligosaccharide flippase family protein [Syntrophobacter fumaroxidans]